MTYTTVERPDHQRLGLHDFAKQLARSNDLDPVCTLVKGADLDYTHLSDWLVCYWFFFHAGTACWVLEEPDYWDAMFKIASTHNHPRGPERNDFHGTEPIKSVKEMRDGRFNKRRNLLFWLSFRGRPRLAFEVAGRVGGFRAFQKEQVARRVVGMVNHLGLCPVTFDVSDVLTPQVRSAVRTAWHRDNPGLVVEDEGFPVEVDQVFCKILRAMNDTLTVSQASYQSYTPYDASLVLDKWGRHVNGTYNVGDDATRLYDELQTYPTARMSHRLVHAGKRTGLW